MKELPKKHPPYEAILTFVLLITSIFFLPPLYYDRIPIIIILILIISAILAYFEIKKNNKDPYPGWWLVDAETLIELMKEVENFCMENEIDTGLEIYLYNDKERAKVSSWHYAFSEEEIDQTKGNIFHYNEEEFSSLKELIDKKIKIIKGTILIWTDWDSYILDNYKKEHPELDICGYVDNLKNL